MASNQQRFVRNIVSGDVKPLIMLGKFQAGATQAIKRGEILELTADTNSRFVPIDADFAGSANVAIANEEIKSGDRAGYYEVIVPRPGDLFAYDLDAANNPEVGVDLFFDTSETVSESGSNALAQVAGQVHYPLKQGHLADDASGDSGETLRDTTEIHMTFKEAVSWLKAFQKA